jgi:ABC-type glycerol-3-phosphate transport system substrate-binding protein
MRASAALLLACIGLAACGGAPVRSATAAPLTADNSRHAVVPIPPRPAVAPADLNVADFMYGPPPHNRIDPRMRCRFDCPTYPANLPPPVQ